MKFKLALLSLSILGLAACSDSEQVELKTGNQASEVQKTQTVKSDVAKPSLSKDEFLVYDFDTKAKDEQLQILINESIQEYEKLVKDVRNQFNGFRTSLNGEYEANINEIKGAMEEQEELHNKNCSEINSSNQESCNKIGANVTQLKNKIQELEADKTNAIRKLDSDETNNLKKYQAKLKTNISKLKAQEK